MLTIAKVFHNFPFAHRQPNHKGHCRLIHGHNWSFKFEFTAKTLDENGFVVDFGGLGWLKQWLTERFDHTLVLNDDDPYLGHLQQSLGGTPCLAKIYTVPNCGAEGLASHLFEQVGKLISEKTEGRVSLVSVTVFEDDKNSATYAA